MIRKFSLIFLVLFTGCSSVTKSVETPLMKVDEINHDVKSGYESSKHTLKKSYVKLTEGFENFSSGFYENSFTQFFLSDETILKSRENLIIWDKGFSSREYEKVLGKKIRGSLSNKFDHLGNYYSNLLQKEFKQKFSSKYPKPKVDEFKTDRQNLQAINKYKFQLQLSKQEWELNSKSNKKIIASNVLSSLYGKPEIEKISYDVNEEKLYVTIKSQRNGFSQNFYFEVGPKKAKAIKSSKNYLKPKLYFSYEDEQLQLIGSSFVYKNNNYLAKVTDSMFQKQNNFKVIDTSLDIASVNVDYKMVTKDVKPPQWFYNLKQDGIIGYGMGDTQIEAKNIAFKEIAEQLSVTVNSQTSVSKQASKGTYQKDVQQNLNLETKKLNLKGSQTIKSEKKNGVWFIAVKK